MMRHTSHAAVLRHTVEEVVESCTRVLDAEAAAVVDFARNEVFEVRPSLLTCAPKPFEIQSRPRVVMDLPRATSTVADSEREVLCAAASTPWVMWVAPQSVLRPISLNLLGVYIWKLEGNKAQAMLTIDL